MDAKVKRCCRISIAAAADGQKGQQPMSEGRWAEYVGSKT
jgi:hypothetical protein